MFRVVPQKLFVCHHCPIQLAIWRHTPFPDKPHYHDVSLLNPPISPYIPLITSPQGIDIIAVTFSQEWHVPQPKHELCFHQPGDGHPPLKGGTIYPSKRILSGGGMTIGQIPSPDHATNTRWYKMHTCLLAVPAISKYITIGHCYMLAGGHIPAFGGELTQVIRTKITTTAAPRIISYYIHGSQNYLLSPCKLNYHHHHAYSHTYYYH
jgi:hypothetical protein